MRVLLYSMVVYLMGIAAILWLRPALMFKKNGEWKEFGTTSTDTTVFPFWLFCTVWAVVTYVCMSYVITEDYMDLMKTTSTAASVIEATQSASPAPAPPTRNLTPEEVEESPEMSKPGYYKLNTAVTKNRGVPMYIYIGTEKPGDLEE